MPAIEIAKAEKSFFPSIDVDVLARCIAGYQQLSCWTSHVEITRPAFEVALDVFEILAPSRSDTRTIRCARHLHPLGEAHRTIPSRS